VDGVSEEVVVETLSEIEVSSGGKNGSKKKSIAANAPGGSRPRPSHDGCVTTAMPGTIVDVKVKAGDKVNAGDGVLVIEAMKMENEIQSPKSGIVVSVHVKKGDSVTPDETLIEIQ
jgi:pyruvate carboxylase subunit B